MRIYTQKQINQIKNQALNKIYHSLVELIEKDDLTIERIKSHRHDEILSIALKHLNSEPTDNVYGWIKRAELKGSFLR